MSVWIVVTVTDGWPFAASVTYARPISAETVEVVPKIGSTRTPGRLDRARDRAIRGRYCRRSSGPSRWSSRAPSSMATSPNGPVLVIPCATHCLLVIEPPSPRRSIVWMIEEQAMTGDVPRPGIDVGSLGHRDQRRDRAPVDILLLAIVGLDGEDHVGIVELVQSCCWGCHR